jgi:hypothetical protein
LWIGATCDAARQAANKNPAEEAGLLHECSSYDVLALQLPFLQVSESMGNHDSDIVDANGVD